jgi:hypothetical protein
MSFDFPILTQYIEKTAERSSLARNYLLTPEGRSAIALLMSIRQLYGIESFYWEPETLWITLQKDGLDISDLNKDKIQAALSIIHNPAFFWDNLVFQRTVQSFNDVIYDANTLQECQPAHICWALYEASLLRGLDPDTSAVPELDEDVRTYCAVCLRRAGMVCPPNIISHIAPYLSALYPNESEEFIQLVKKSWDHLNKSTLKERSYSENPLDVQLAQLAACTLYEKSRAAAMASEVLSLEKGDVS